MPADSDQGVPWQAQLGWTYIGHGEWAQAGEEVHTPHGNDLKTEPDWVISWMKEVDQDIRMHQEVLHKGYPNRWGAQIPVQTRWNLQLLDTLLQGYEDAEVVQWLRYGWPTGRLPTLPLPKKNHKNHSGATDYPEQLTRYINKEMKYAAVMGPYENIPFNGKVGISPLSTRAKKDSDDRRIILDP